MRSNHKLTAMCVVIVNMIHVQTWLSVLLWIPISSIIISVVMLPSKIISIRSKVTTHLHSTHKFTLNISLNTL